MDANKLKNILEAGLLVAGRTMSIAQLEALFQHDAEKPERKQIKEALESLKEDYNGRGIELVEVASGFRLQSHASVSDWVANLFQEKAPRYSRALLETLVLIAYRQPITRAEIEEVRGVAVSSNIIKTLQERQWVKVLGHKEVPGRPALLGTSKEFLDYFNLKKLDDLPSLADIKDLDQFDELLAAEVGEIDDAEQGDAANDDVDEHSAETQSGGSDASSVNGATVNGAAQGDSTSGEASDTASDIAGDIDSAEFDAAGSNDDDSSTGAEGDNAQNNNSHDDDSASANLASNGPSVWDLSAKSKSDTGEEEGNTGQEEKEGGADSDSEDDDAAEHNETLSGPELELLRVISDFSEEHQEQIDARDQMEAGIVSNPERESDDADVADLSQRVGEDRKSGDLPEPGDTLH